jgi:hypothetical protein
VSNYTAEDGATETLADEFTRSKAVFDLGHIQTLNWHERLFLGLLVKSLI